MTRHYPDLGSASDWLKREGISFPPIRSTTKIWIVTRHQYGISVLVTQTSFCEGRETLAVFSGYSRLNVSPSETKIEPDRRLQRLAALRCINNLFFYFTYFYTFLCVTNSDSTPSPRPQTSFLAKFISR